MENSGGGDQAVGNRRRIGDVEAGGERGDGIIHGQNPTGETWPEKTGYPSSQRSALRRVAALHPPDTDLDFQHGHRAEEQGVIALGLSPSRHRGVRPPDARLPEFGNDIGIMKIHLAIKAPVDLAQGIDPAVRQGKVNVGRRRVVQRIQN